MPRASKASKDSKQSKRRLAALAVLLCLLAVALLAEIFIITPLNQDCLGDCLVCKRLCHAKKALNQTKESTVALLIAASALVTMLILSMKRNDFGLYFLLPVDEKIRINV